MRRSQQGLPAVTAARTCGGTNDYKGEEVKQPIFGSAAIGLSLALALALGAGPVGAVTENAERSHVGYGQIWMGSGQPSAAALQVTLSGNTVEFRLDDEFLTLADWSWIIRNEDEVHVLGDGYLTGDAAALESGSGSLHERPFEASLQGDLRTFPFVGVGSYVGILRFEDLRLTSIPHSSTTFGGITFEGEYELLEGSTPTGERGWFSGEVIDGFWDNCSQSQCSGPYFMRGIELVFTITPDVVEDVLEELDCVEAGDCPDIPDVLDGDSGSEGCENSGDRVVDPIEGEVGDESDPDTHATYEVEAHQISNPDPTGADYVEVCAEVTGRGQTHRHIVRVDPNLDDQDEQFKVDVNENAPDGAGPGSPCTRNVYTNNNPRLHVRRSADGANPQTVCVGVPGRNIWVSVEQT